MVARVLRIAGVVPVALVLLFSVSPVVHAEEPSCPDLAVTFLSAPGEVSTVRSLGKIAVPVTFTIANLAPSVPFGDWWLYFVLLKDGQQVGAMILVLSDENYPVGGSPLVSLTDTITLYLDNKPPGDYWLLLHLSHHVLEDPYLLDNNEMSVPILFKVPNLEVQSPIVVTSGFTEGPGGEATFGAEDFLTIKFTVVNDGTADIDGIFWGDQLWASVDDQFDNEEDRCITGARHGGDLPVGSSYTDTYSVYVPTLTKNGEKYLIHIVNAGGDVYESDKNNQLWITLPPVAYRLKIGTYPSEGGTTDPAPGEYIYPADTIVDITVATNPGYDFLFWGGDEEIAGRTAPSISVKMDGNKPVNAFFAKQQYSLTLNVNGRGTTNPAPGIHSYPRGSIVQLTATPDPGYRFVNWTGDLWGVTGDPTSRSISVAMHTDWTITANFVPSGITLIQTIKASPSQYVGKTVKLSGVYRGWEYGHGSPPVTRNDWVLQDTTGSIYITGNSLGLRHPQDIGKPVTVTGTVRLKNGVPYIVVSRYY